MNYCIVLLINGYFMYGFVIGRLWVENGRFKKNKKKDEEKFSKDLILKKEKMCRRRLE